MHTLRGHTDAIMCAGFSPDQKLIASVSWDQSFRIWDANDGSCLHTFKTKQQNWTGRFSPDSKYFAGTSGDGFLWIYDVIAGTTVVSHDFGNNTGRSWGRSLDWQPNGAGAEQKLALGCGDGVLYLFEFNGKDLNQLRRFEMLRDNNPKRMRRIMRSFLEISGVTFVSGGEKLIWRCSSDYGFFAYDVKSDTLWRLETERRKEVNEMESSEAPHLLSGSKGLIASLTSGKVTFWKFPSEIEGWSAGAVDGWMEKSGVWRKPGAEAAHEVFIEY